MKCTTTEKLRRPLYEQGLVDFLFGLVDSDKTTLVMKRSSAKTIGVALADGVVSTNSTRHS